MANGPPTRSKEAEFGRTLDVGAMKQERSKDA